MTACCKVGYIVNRVEAHTVSAITVVEILGHIRHSVRNNTTRMFEFVLI